MAERSPSRLAATALVAALLLLAAERAGEPGCRCGSGRLELVFVLDTTASMKAVIGTVKEQCAKIIHVLEGHVENLRVGVVLYKTASSPDFVTRELNLTADRRSVVEFLGRVETKGGGFEAVEQGLRVAIDSMDWTAGARKVVVIVGDEPPDPKREDDLYALAAEAAKRGIVVNTITGSETAWRYYKLTHQEESQRLYDEQGDSIKLDFRLPCFVKTSEIAGGKSVGGRNVREIVRSLLSFGLGRDVGEVGPVDIDEFFRWRPGEELGRGPGAGPAGASRAMMARLIYRGEWRTPRDFAALHEHLSGALELDLKPGVPDVAPTDEALSRFGLVYVSGHGPVELKEFETTSLADYVAGGGAIWADACCGSERFDESIRELVPKIAAGARLERLPADHPVYSVGYAVGKVRLCAEHRSEKLSESAPALEGAFVDGRLVVVYSRQSLGSTWRTYRFGLPCMMSDADGRRLSANVLLYFLTR